MSFIELIKVAILGVVEGITEWLPISSTGHMLLVDEFLKLNMTAEFKDMFFVVIQLGAIIAVVVLFWNKMFPFKLEGGVRINWEIMELWFKVVVACVPLGIVGIFFDDFISERLHSPMVIAAMLIFYGILFIVIESWNKRRSPTTNTLAEITYKTAVIIGVFQVLSAVPGTSRSGATIIGALLIGVSRTAAAEFTFFLAVPTMLGASAFKLMKFGFGFSGAELVTLAVGMIIAFAVSLATIRFLMSYIQKHDFKAFGWYRIALGIVVLLYFGIGALAG